MNRIAVPVADGFEDSELTTPVEILKGAGHEPVLLGRPEDLPGDADTSNGEATGKVTGKRGTDVLVTRAARAADPADFAGLLIPGGTAPDVLRMDPGTVDFVRRFIATGKPVAAVCHGPQLLIEADVVRGLTLTSWPSVRKDLENAGARWVDAETVVDRNLITARKPDDLKAFTEAFLQALREQDRAVRQDIAA